MNSGSVRVIHHAPRSYNSTSILIVMILLLPLFSPISSVNAEARIESQDFQILDDLDSVLGQRQDVLDSNSVGQIAGPSLDAVRDGISDSGPNQPLSSIGEALVDSSMVETSQPSPDHPLPYNVILGIEGGSTGQVDNVWQTLVNITDYVILTEFKDLDGNVIRNTEVVTFTANFLSLLNLQTDPLSHAVDVDNDGDDDIQVGLGISLGPIGLDNIISDSGTLWIQPAITYSVDVLD